MGLVHVDPSVRNKSKLYKSRRIAPVTQTTHASLTSLSPSEAPFKLNRMLLISTQLLRACVCDRDIRLRHSIHSPGQFQTICYPADNAAAPGYRHAEGTRVAPGVNDSTSTIERQGCGNGIRGFAAFADYRAIGGRSAEGQARICTISRRGSMGRKTETQHQDQHQRCCAKLSFHKNHLLPQNSTGFDFLPCKCRRRRFSYNKFDKLFQFSKTFSQPNQLRLL